MRYTNIQYLEKEAVTVSIQNLNLAKTILDGQVVFACSWDLLGTYDANTGITQNAKLSSIGVAAQTANDAVGGTGGTTNVQGLAIGIAKVNPTTYNISTTGQASLPLLGVGEAICYGFTDAIVQTRTRATSTDSWGTQAGFAAGDQLIPETVNNNLKWQGTLALSGARVQFVAAQSLASLASYNSINNPNVTGAGTVETIRMKVRVCCM